MKNIVIFAEGKGEIIFLRQVLFQIIGYEYLSFECLELIADDLSDIPYRYSPPNALIHYLLINVGTDERVLSEIRDRHEKLVEQGSEVVGLRDMYCELYKRNSNVIIQELSNTFIRNHKSRIEQMKYSDKIHFFFEIMELEAWLLGMYHNLERMDARLTAEYIYDNLGFDLRVIDPETTFFHPASQLKQVLRLADIEYDKHASQIENCVSRLVLGDITQLIETGRCNSFALLISEIEREFEEAIEDA